MQIIAILIATLIPAIFFYFIYTRDLYKTGNFVFVLLAGGAGLAAFGFATLINPLLVRQGILTNSQVVRYSAPILEEILKALILFLLIRSPKFTYFVDGAIYGFAAGISFAVVENWQYIMGS